MEIKQDLQANPEEKLAEAENDEKVKQEAVQKLLDQLELNDVTKKRLEVSRRFGYSKNLRKEVGFFVIYAIEGVQKEIARRLGLTLAQVRYFLPEEISAALEGKRLDVDLANKRRVFCIYLYDHGKHRILTGNEAVVLAETLRKPERDLSVSELKGQCACPGQAKGRTRIVMSAEDGGKMQKGDVLVSFSTNPNMVPAMKLASAIVTDVGGVTCHAAIVSRELKIPCVIGTKIATKWLKDGDLVEVDATRGIVRKA
ncbi:hypothetical protein HZC09_00290 [Candidatus Micrarchaeota archaeon]|nr:hypothetical protein [Candidatus Micrarchaeota archaeon]